MASCIVMPKAGVTVETCIMGAWEKKIGDPIKNGDLVFSYETDKSVFEYRAVEDGTLLAIFAEEGDDVPVLTPVCVIGTPGEDISDIVPAVETEPAEEERNITTEKAADIAVPLPVPVESQQEDVLRISPRAKNLAERMDIHDLTEIPGTGPMGRVIERDVRTFAKNQHAKPEQSAMSEKEASTAKPTAEETEYTDQKLSNIRKVIAKNMQQSLTNMAQLTHNTSFDASNVIAYRKELKAVSAQRDFPNISLNDIIIYAVSRVLLHHPDLNAHFLGEKIRYFKHVHIGIAVDTNKGLMVPTIFNADQKSLKEIAIEAKQLSSGCRDGNISPDLLKGASFTISNLGPFGIESFTPIINPPQTGILGVDCTIDRVRQTESGIQVYPAMGLSLTYDHRALDGAPASRFLQELCGALESFTVLLAE